MEEMTVKEEAKRIPYGMMNFVAVREDNCYYVDKTRFIEKVEKANKYFFFIRPRRFGKSLYRCGTVVCRHSRGAAFQLVDGHRERCSQHRGVVFYFCI